MGKIITIKNNKGGVGKTFIATQLASGLSMLDKKVLILTSDSQNNVFTYLLKGNSEFERGLKTAVTKGNGEYFRLRENLYFLPLEDSKFSPQFLKALPDFLYKCKDEYDYIIIDSTPVLKIDNVFLENTDYIIIPGYGDKVTTESMINILDQVDIKKILCVVLNRYRPSEIQKMFAEEIKSATEGTNIDFITPIPHLTFIEKMLYGQKTIWEFTNKDANKIQDIFCEIIRKIQQEEVEESNGTID
ncbi:ParA family protein [Cetobacterium sp. SF1]|uniref:ParA family protein n=1 Tax=unclassified Cetobacterium TaxID=2630983 RepID=UPI003CED9AEE